MAGPDLRISLVVNGYPDSDVLMTEGGKALEAALDHPTITLFARKNASTTTVTAEELGEIVADCGAVVTAMGHCGSRRSTAVRDPVLASRGSPGTRWRASSACLAADDERRDPGLRQDRHRPPSDMCRV